MALRSPSQADLLPLQTSDGTAGWLARIGLHVECFTRSQDSKQEILQQVLGFFDIRNLSGRSPARTIRAALAKRLRRCGNGRSQNPPFFAGVERLGRIVGLSLLQQEMLALAICAREVPALKDVVSYFAPGKTDLCRSLALILGSSEADVRTALRRDGALVASGLVWLDAEQEDLVSQLNLLDGLSVRLADSAKTDEELIGRFVDACPGPGLTRGDFSHVEADVAVLARYISASAQTKAMGVNVLLYGVPGTGKTELAKIIATETGLRAYQVRFVSDAREPMSPKERLASYQLCQRLLSRRGTSLVIFDEVEDVFVEDIDSLALRIKKGAELYGKAWMNNLLENNPVPTIWICNDVEQMDRAYLRRFDFSIRFHTLPRSARLRIVKKHLANSQCSERVLSELADNETLLPSQVAKVAKMIALCGGDRGLGEAVLERSMHNSRALLDQRVRSKSIAASCNLAYLNTDSDPERLLVMLKKRAGPARLCFYGPPGTGKTAFSRRIAAEADRPLVERKMSDLLSPWVGGTERQIADAFETADRDGAILLLDEAEGLLLDRQDAVRSWEITQVNEMLTQLEAFAGVLICCTNLMVRLDAASLRRFDIKLRFDYLTHEQSWRLFCETVEAFGDKPDERFRGELRRAAKLAPADFAVATRRLALLGVPITSSSLLEALRSESAFRSAAPGHAIGFIT